MRILTYSTLYPNCIQPNHGIFVETRLRNLLEVSGIEAKVVAPVPWFPSQNPVFGRYAKFAAVPAVERRSGLHVYHPRYPVIPKYGMILAPVLLALASLPIVRKLKRDFNFQMIDAHYFYPDGVAAALLAKWLRMPLFITARGTDVNIIPSFMLPRKMIQWAASCAINVIAVSKALMKKLVEVGVPEAKIHVIRNGVDLDLFRPFSVPIQEREDGEVFGKYKFLSVGNLVENKGHHLVVEIMEFFPNCSLRIVGNGPMLGRLEALILERGVHDRVQIHAAVPQKELCNFYNNADVLILASSREGCPNVLLEAMACGTPVVATDVGGVKEIILNEVIGRVASERSIKAIAAAVLSILENYPDPQNIRSYAEQFGWRECSIRQLQLLDRLCDQMLGK